MKTHLVDCTHPIPRWLDCQECEDTCTEIICTDCGATLNPIHDQTEQELTA
jgi:hypothetical protein